MRSLSRVMKYQKNCMLLYSDSFWNYIRISVCPLAVSAGPFLFLPSLLLLGCVYAALSSIVLIRGPLFSSPLIGLTIQLFRLAKLKEKCSATYFVGMRNGNK